MSEFPFLRLDSIPLYVYTTSIHSSINVHLCSFHLLALMNNAAVNMVYRYIFNLSVLKKRTFQFFWIFTQKRHSLLDHILILFLSFRTTVVFHSNCFTLAPTGPRSSSFCTSSTPLRFFDNYPNVSDLSCFTSAEKLSAVLISSPFYAFFGLLASGNSCPSALDFTFDYFLHFFFISDLLLHILELLFTFFAIIHLFILLL